MRDPLLLRTRLPASQLTAEHVRRLQVRRETALGRHIPPGNRFLAKQIAGFPGNAYAIWHTAPRILVIDCLTPSVVFSFHFAAQAVLRLRKHGDNFLASGCRAESGADSIQPAASCSNALTK